MSEPRVQLKPCGSLGIYVYIDDKLMDIFHLSDLQKMMGLNQKTIDAIEQIYNDIIEVKE